MPTSMHAFGLDSVKEQDDEDGGPTSKSSPERGNGPLDPVLLTRDAPYSGVRVSPTPDAR
ncbi:hypothetical protein OC835_007073 [Tilletia horrida]|nr:hypothetical protein OC835_007073 [Tilletia horrida]